MIFKRVGEDRPYPEHGYTQRQWASIAPYQVRLDQLVTTKRTLDLDTLLEEDSTFYGDLFAHVVAYQGELYLEDGLHRALRAALQQRQTMHARVLASTDSEEGGLSVRLFRLIATPIVLLVLLGLLLWSASWGWRNLTAPLPTPDPTPCVTQPVDVVTPDKVSVRVLNGGFTSGLAGQASGRLETAGFKIVTVGNTDERVTSTVIRGNAENDAALQLTASYFNGATIEHDDRVDGTIDVFVGSDFGGYGEGPLTETTSNTGNLCVPPTPEATPIPDATTPAPEATEEGE